MGGAVIGLPPRAHHHQQQPGGARGFVPGLQTLILAGARVPVHQGVFKSLAKRRATRFGYLDETPGQELLVVRGSGGGFEDQAFLARVGAWLAQAFGQGGAAALDQGGSPQSRVMRRNVHGVDYRMTLTLVESCKGAWGIVRQNYAGFSRTGSAAVTIRSEEHTSELQSHHDLVCR